MSEEPPYWMDEFGDLSPCVRHERYACPLCPEDETVTDVVEDL